MSVMGFPTGVRVTLPAEMRGLVSAAGARRVLAATEPLLPVAGEAAGLGAPEVLALIVAVRVARRLLPAAGPGPVSTAA